MKQPFFACDRCVSRRVRQDRRRRTPRASSARYPVEPDAQGPEARAPSAKRSASGSARKPETYAAHAYDGMNMLIWAIQVAGLNRAKIRDVLAYRTEPWPGVTGDISFSACLDDIGEVFLAKSRTASGSTTRARTSGFPGATSPRATA